MDASLGMFLMQWLHDGDYFLDNLKDQLKIQREMYQKLLYLYIENWCLKNKQSLQEGSRLALEAAIEYFYDYNPTEGDKRILVDPYRGWWLYNEKTHSMDFADKNRMLTYMDKFMDERRKDGVEVQKKRKTVKARK